MIDPDKIPPELWKEMNVTREQFAEIQRQQAQREKKAPPVGSPAPDFELHRLDEGGKLGDETVRLSALRGRPVALAFGSYT